MKASGGGVESEANFYKIRWSNKSCKKLKDVERCWKCQQTIYSKPDVSLPVPCLPSSSQSAFETQIQHHLLQELGFLLTLITSGHLQTLSSTVLALELKQSPKILGCTKKHQNCWFLKRAGSLDHGSKVPPLSYGDPKTATSWSHHLTRPRG